MNYCQKYLSAGLLGIAALAGGASPAWAQTAPSLGAADSFAVLSVGTSTTPSTTPDATAAVSTTDSTVIGDVGSAGAVTLTGSVITGNVVLTGALTNTGSTISGTTTSPLPVGVITDFNTAYDALAAEQCDFNLTGQLLDGQSLAPGVYCFDAAVTETNSVLTLVGDGIWIFQIGKLGTGALTGTNFSVVMDGGQPCNVYWWVAEAVTMTTSGFQGTILAGAAITATGVAEPTTSFNGDALAKAAVTLTNFTVTGCEGGGRGDKSKSKCNQGIGNGPEGCDPGNSTLNPFRRSNDELGGAPGDPGPGRKGGNKK